MSRERSARGVGVIGMALLSKRAGSGQGIDHFGFEVDDVKEAVERLNQFYPDLLHTRALTYVPFAGEQHGFRRAENMKRALDAELYFYSRVFGFELADPVEPVVIENLGDKT